MTVRVNYINKNDCIYRAFNVERVMILNIDMIVSSIVSSERLCIIREIVFDLLLTFWYVFAVRVDFDLIIRHDCSNQLFHQMNCIYRISENVTISIITQVKCIVRKFAFVCHRLRYVFVARFVRFVNVDVL